MPSFIWNVSTCDQACLQKERHTLLDMHASFNGDNWYNKWDINRSTKIVPDASHCDWFGVICDNVTNHVIAINMPRNNLHGNLFPNLKGMQMLLGLCFGVNSLTVDMQRILDAVPRHMVRLEFAYNGIQGSIPDNIAEKVPLLSKLQLSGNPVSGRIPDSFGELSKLTVFSIGETKIRGVIPESLSNLTNVWFLDLEALELYGDISIFRNLRKLSFLHLSSNNIRGTIPVDAGQRFPNLIELLLQNNNLAGPLPPSIGNLKKLDILNVARNRLTGSIPSELSQLNLTVLVLSSNSFTGFEPGFDSFKTLNIFMASNLPAFNCSLKTILSYIKPSRKTLMQIDLSNSNIYGDFHESVFSFKRLTFLKLASNKLTGPIPSPIDNLPYLTMLDVKNNNLSGQIPIAFSRLLMLTELHLEGNRYMSGPIVASFLALDHSIRVKERITDTCPLVRFAHNHGSVYVDSSYYHRRYCHCDEHFYGNGGYCFPCMHGSYCPGSSKGSKTAPKKLFTIYETDSSISKMYLLKGYYPFPSESNVTSIQKCPTSIYYHNICVPQKTCDCLIARQEGGSEQGRINNSKTESGIRCNQNCLCLAGHHGRFCSQCRPGYYKEGIRCFKCPRGRVKSLELGILFGSTIIAFCISITVFYISMTRLKLSIALALAEFILFAVLALNNLVPAFLIQLLVIIYALGFSSYLKRCTGLLKSAIFYLQVMDTLISTTDIWPKSIYNAQMYASSALNFHFSSLACFLPDLFTLSARHLILFFLPLLCLSLIWAVFYIWKCFKKPNEDTQKSMNFKCRKYCLTFIDLAYFPIVGSSLSILIGCRQVDGVHFMKSFVWVDCNSFEHTTLKVVAILALVFYVIGVPFFIYTPLLCRYRKHLSDDDSDVSQWLGPLITPYKAKCRTYVEVVMVIRRLLIAILMTSFPENAPEQTQCIAVLLIVAIIYQALGRPFKNPTEQKLNGENGNGLGLENIVGIFMLTSVLLSFICVGLSIGHGRFSPTSALFVLTLAVNGLFIITFLFSILYRLRTVARNGDLEGRLSGLREPLLEEDRDSYPGNFSRDSRELNVNGFEHE